MKVSMRKYIYLLLGIIAIIACGAAYYFLYYIKTPEYTCKIIADAYKAHDVYQVHRHVDVDNILNKFIDEALDGQPELKDNPFAQALLPVAKQMATAIAKEQIDKAIMGDLPKTEVQENGSKPTNDLQSASKDSTFKSFSSKKQNDNNAEIYLDFIDKNGKARQLTMKARRIEDGTWQIYEAPGMYKLVEDINANK